jgi:putative serine protease PepD
VSFDDDATDDSAGFRPPPHPDDRLWRHPSELRAQGRRSPKAPAAHSRWGPVAVAAAGIGLVGGSVGIVALGLRDHTSQPGTVAQAMVSPVQTEPGVPPDYAIANPDETDSAHVDLARGLAPSVVRVDRGSVRGSGIIIRDDGLVLTAAAVVGEGGEVAVALGDGRLLSGTTVATDALTGLALVDLPGEGYTETELTEVPASDIYGQSTLAIGVDDDGRLVLDAGDVAAAPSRVDRADEGLPALDGVLAVDTTVDPVVRGGPVIDEAGNIVGLTIWSDDQWTYAAPNATLRKVVDDVVDTGQVRHTWLGIDGYEASDNGWPAGVAVARVAPEGPSAGVLQNGDVIIAIDQQLVSQMSALVVELRAHDPGDVIQLSYRRNGQPGARTAPVVLTPRPSSLNSE